MAQTTEEFIAKAKQVWGDEYDYSLAVYQGPLCPVTIVCRIHGPFRQMPYNHLNGHRCFECGIAARRSTTMEFVVRARELFPDYDYSRVAYVNANVNVLIGCPWHGWFERRPSDLLWHIRGCPACLRQEPRIKPGPRFKLEGWKVEVLREVLREMAGKGI